jgi:hypothetical protein
MAPADGHRRHPETRDAREIGKLPAQEQALPAAPAPTPEPVLIQPVSTENRPTEEPVSTAPLPRVGDGAKTPKGRGDYGVITLGPPASIAAEFRSRLTLKDLQTLVELLSMTTAR